MKLFEWYVIKERALWLQEEWDDVCNERIDNTPKLSFVLALDWKRLYQYPYKHRREPEIDKDYYSYLNIRFYLLFYQLCVTIRLNRMSYRNLEQYRFWRKNVKTRVV